MKSSRIEETSLQAGRTVHEADAALAEASAPGAPARRTWSGSSSTTAASRSSDATAPPSRRRRSTGLAAGGLRYTNFHVTAMCSPTRTCLLTGRNHHAAGMGYLADFDTGFDNARGAISPRAATLAEMLREGGYGTYALGKWHLVPPPECSPAGPFDNWPTQRGFNRYYGFLGGEEDQWAPELWYDQHHVPPPTATTTTSARTWSTARRSSCPTI